MNKWRKVQYLNDGVDEYQCLKCKSRFCVFSYVELWKFCPFCGTQWEGQHECSTRDERREKIYDKMTEAQREQESLRYREFKSHFVVQKQCLWKWEPQLVEEEWNDLMMSSELGYKEAFLRWKAELEFNKDEIETGWAYLRLVYKPSKDKTIPVPGFSVGGKNDIRQRTA